MNWKVSLWGPWVALNVQKAGHNRQLQFTVGPWGRTQLKITLHLLICWTQLSEGNVLLHHSRVHSPRQSLSPLYLHHAPGLLSLKRYGRQTVPRCWNVESLNFTGCFFNSASIFFRKLKHQLSKFQLIFRNDLPWSGPRYYSMLRTQDWMRLWTFCNWNTNLDQKRWGFWTARM